MTQQLSALQFTGKEIRSAIRLYFEPLFWIGKIVPKLKNRITLSSSTDLARKESLELSRASKAPERTHVIEDWTAWLSEDKAKFFDSRVRQLEAAYGMFSISLNEALELWRIGQTARARQAIALIPALCVSLTDSVYTILRALLSHARNCGTVANVAPLDEANFRGKRSQRVARINHLLTAVLLTKRALFFHKVSALEELIGDLTMDIRVAADELATYSSTSSDPDWMAIDDAHFDINTCLRETIIILKSFLVAMPNEELQALEGEINHAWRREPETDPTSLYEHRRWTPLTSDEIVHTK